MAQRSNSQHKLYDSTIETVATTITDASLLDDLETHYIGMRYYADDAGAVTATPGAGTVAIQVLDEATNQWTAVTGSPVDATDVTDKVTHTGNITGVRAIPTGVTTATHMQLFSSSNL